MISVGARNMGIGLSVRLRDHFTSRAHAVSASMHSLSANAIRMQRANLSAMRGIGIGMVVAGGLAIRGMGRAVGIAKKYEFTMGAVKAVTQATGVEMKLLDRTALNLAKSTVFSAQQIADAMKFMGMAGLSTEHINNAIKAVTDLGASTDVAISGVGGAVILLLT